ncbi:MAG: Uma2 family endonuclease [Bryobacterales bacterium]|nr:Uma2 family endonuclease [Bryobacterales bacterium]
MTDDEFLRFAAGYEGYRLETNAEGEVVVMPPAGAETSARNAKILFQLGAWALRRANGAFFDSSGGFRLPNGARRSPDAAWISSARLRTVAPAQRRSILPVAPDFVIELLSPSDRLAAAQAKMREYLSNGVQLGWLIDADRRQVHIYRPHREPEILSDPSQVQGEGPVKGFTLQLQSVWEGLSGAGTAKPRSRAAAGGAARRKSSKT